MQVQSITTTSPNFKALTITSEAMQVLKREKGGARKINQYTKELADCNKMNIHVSKTKGRDDIWMDFSGHRCCWLAPCRMHDDMILFYSSDRYGDNEDDIVDALKFSNAERAKEIYDNIMQIEKEIDKSPLRRLMVAVESAKAFEEGSPITIADYWYKADRKHYDTYFAKPSERISPQPVKVQSQVASKAEKPSFSQRLKAAWNVLLGK